MVRRPETAQGIIHVRSSQVKPKTKTPSLQGGSQYADAKDENNDASQSTGRFPSDALGPGGMLKYKVVGKSASQRYLRKHRNTHTLI